MARKQHFSISADYIRDIILLIRPSDGRILKANAAAREYGYPPRELLQLTIQDLRAPETQGAVSTQMKEADAGGILFETVHRRKDGSLFAAEVNSRGVTIRGERVLISVIRNITARKAAEAVRNRLAAIVEGSRDAIISKTLDGIITSWNRGAEMIYGYSSEEVLGRPVSLLMPPDMAGEMPKILERIGNDETIFHYETERVKKGGESISVSLTVSPVKDDSGAVVGVSSVARDVSERKAAEKEREALIEKLREALANIKTLSELLPICSHCKKIRDDAGYWEQLESYIGKHAGTRFSHGICPECLAKHYPQVHRGISDTNKK